MYKNLTYYNKYKSRKQYENKILESCLFDNIIKAKEGKKETIYKSPELIISINNSTINFLIFNQKKYEIVEKIKKLLNT